MWMSGPAWGYLSVDDAHEFKGASDEIIWSAGSQYLAFVTLHIEDAPNRKGAEGINFRVGLLRISDWQLRYCLGNLKLSEIKLSSFSEGLLMVLVNGKPKQIQADKIQW